MTSPKSKLRWGVLGYARIARESVMPAIGRTDNSELYGLASRDAAKLAEARQRFPSLARTYIGYDELLDDPAVDAVYIPLPNAMHREWAIKAAERGKHVLCEKPIALNASECREMVNAFRAHQVILMEAFMYRYTDRTRQALSVVRSGQLGEVKQVNASFRFLLGNPASIKLQDGLGGGSLYDVGCYPVNFVGMVMDALAGEGPGSAALPVSVVGEQIDRGGVDVNFAGLLRYPSGVVASIQSGFNAHRHVMAEIIGTNGVLEVPDTYFDPAGTLTLTMGEQRVAIPVAASDRYRQEVEDFASAVMNGHEPHFSLQETQRNMEIIDQLYASARRLR